MRRRQFVEWCVGLASRAFTQGRGEIALAADLLDCSFKSYGLGLSFATVDTLNNIAHLTGGALRAVAASDSRNSSLSLPSYFNLEDPKLMAQYGWPGNMMPPSTAQGHQSSCVAWAVGYSMGSFLATVQSVASRKPPIQLSAADLYAKVLRREPGKVCGDPTFVKDAMDVMVLEGVAGQMESPYSESKCSLPLDSGIYLMDGYHRLTAGDAVAIKSQLSNFLVLPFGMIVYKDFATLSQDAVYTHAQTETSCALGAHCMVLVGYDDAKSAYRVMNSWGPSWADSGFGWIAYDTFAQSVPEVYSPYTGGLARSTMESSTSSSSTVKITQAYVSTPLSQQSRRLERLVFSFRMNEPLSTKGYAIRAIDKFGRPTEVYRATLNQLLRASYFDVPLGSTGEDAVLRNTEFFEVSLNGLSRVGEAVALTAKAKYPDPAGR